MSCDKASFTVADASVPKTTLVPSLPVGAGTDASVVPSSDATLGSALSTAFSLLMTERFGRRGGNNQNRGEIIRKAISLDITRPGYPTDFYLSQ